MCGNFGTYEDVVPMPIWGRVCTIDHCIADIVAALNTTHSTRTTYSCCGHNQIEGCIALHDDRVLIIARRVLVDGSYVFVGADGQPLKLTPRKDMPGSCPEAP